MAIFNSYVKLPEGKCGFYGEPIFEVPVDHSGPSSHGVMLRIWNLANTRHQKPTATYCHSRNKQLSRKSK